MEEDELLIIFHTSLNSVGDSKILSSFLPVGITFYARNIFLMEVIGYRERKGMNLDQSKSVRKKKKFFIRSLNITLKDERNWDHTDHSSEKKDK